MSLYRTRIAAAAMALSLATAATAAVPASPAPAATAAPVASPAPGAIAPWLDARQDKGEVRFTSRMDEDPFSFRIPGQATQQGQDGQFMLATIDTAAFAFGVLWANPDEDSLDAIVAGAKAHARELGATVAPSDECAQAKAVHREWAVKEPGSGTRTVVVAFETAGGALTLRVVDDAGMGGAAKRRAACARFARPKNDGASAKAGPGDTKEPPGGD
jgi:hypothetical protein